MLSRFWYKALGKPNGKSRQWEGPIRSFTALSAANQVQIIAKDWGVHSLDFIQIFPVSDDGEIPPQPELSFENVPVSSDIDKCAGESKIPATYPALPPPKEPRLRPAVLRGAAETSQSCEKKQDDLKATYKLKVRRKFETLNVEEHLK